MSNPFEREHITVVQHSNGKGGIVARWLISIGLKEQVTIVRYHWWTKSCCLFVANGVDEYEVSRTIAKNKGVVLEVAGVFNKTIEFTLPRELRELITADYVPPPINLPKAPDKRTVNGRKPRKQPEKRVSLGALARDRNTTIAAMLSDAIKDANGNVTEACRALGISRGGMLRAIKRHNIDY